MEGDVVTISKKEYKSLLNQVKYLREKHDIHVCIVPEYNKYKLSKKDYVYIISTNHNQYSGYSDVLDVWLGLNGQQIDRSYHKENTYELALLKGVTEALKLI